MTTPELFQVSADKPQPPKARREPVTATLHDDDRVDEFGWMRNKEADEVRAHLEAENVYTAAVMAPTVPLQEALFNEFKARILETDLSVPTAKGMWAYFGRTEEGKQYPSHYRRPITPADESLAPWPQTDPKELPAGSVLLLDENELAGDSDYFSLGTFEVSPKGDLLAYAIDLDGDETYELHVRRLHDTDGSLSTDLPDLLEATSPGVMWSADGTILFYVTLDDAMRPWQVWRHVLGSQQADDVVVFQEDDERFYVGIGLSGTESLLTITVGSQVTSEIHILSAETPIGEFTCVQPRVQDIEYGIEHHRSADGTERIFMITNDGAENFRLVVSPFPFPATETVWTPVLPEWEPDAIGDDRRPVSTRAKLDAIEVFESFVALHERHDGMERVRVAEISRSGEFVAVHTIEHADPDHSTWPMGNAKFETGMLRIGYTSMTTPAQVIDYDMRTRERVIRREQPVLGGFTSTDYVADRIFATASDGTRIPISLVRKRTTPIDGTAPGVLYGYGSYEISIDPTFSVFRLSLLDRGFVFAIAHIRGGGEGGRSWYLDGKFLKKKNTFNDFIASADALVASNYVAPGRLVIRGGSAGGLLMGAVINAAAAKFAGVVAEVPFVDVVTTMLDETLPLTAIEWEEWGNPADPEYYAYMRSYSPFDNVSSLPYPPMLVTAGFNDPRVSYWEPAKWVQRLRERSTGDAAILLKTELGAGHGGPSGRYDSWRDESVVLAFIVSCCSSL
jgi:oligopeptidase B